jgi:hypothetical protein
MTATNSRAGDGVAPVSTFVALWQRYAKAATLKGDERRDAVLRLAAEVTMADQTYFLSFCDPPSYTTAPFPPQVLLALEVFEQRPAFARPAGLAQLASYDDSGPALIAGLERVWDGGGTVEVALCDRLGMHLKDAKQTIVALAHHGTARSVPTLVSLLFDSPEKDGLTALARFAIVEISKRDTSPDLALKPLIDNLHPGWPGPEEPARRRDVILALEASRGRAIPYLEGTIAWWSPWDFDARSLCWRTLARIGTKRALHDLVQAFDDHLVASNKADPAEQRRENAQVTADEQRRLGLLVEAIGEVPPGSIVTNGEFLRQCAGAADSLDADLRAKLLALLERLSGHKLNNDANELRRLGNEIEKNMRSTEGGENENR